MRFSAPVKPAWFDLRLVAGEVNELGPFGTTTFFPPASRCETGASMSGLDKHPLEWH